MSKKYTLGANREGAINLLPDGIIKLVQVGSTKVCLVRMAEAVYAFQHLCPHQAASLYEGKVNGMGQVICPLHHYRFDMKTGDVMSGTCPDLKTFPAKLTEEGIVIYI
ncbi:Rieske (2Fe-2S) protein [Anditalea andensis]|uniref:Nitrite reductase n=1 Tax=Anditalea andensis TaxID=1048983 RepID=A0A074L111_9BACT|nr:Rieske 2Fe-2S domain-containing protein [Anditalea andensis]KEO73538.1 nitrite reductase [Anditalea andensis]